MTPDQVFDAAVHAATQYRNQQSKLESGALVEVMVNPESIPRLKAVDSLYRVCDVLMRAFTSTGQPVKPDVDPIELIAMIRKAAVLALAMADDATARSEARNYV